MVREIIKLCFSSVQIVDRNATYTNIRRALHKVFVPGIERNNMWHKLHIDDSLDGESQAEIRPVPTFADYRLDTVEAILRIALLMFFLLPTGLACYRPRRRNWSLPSVR